MLIFGCPNYYFLNIYSSYLIITKCNQNISIRNTILNCYHYCIKRIFDQYICFNWIVKRIWKSSSMKTVHDSFCWNLNPGLLYPIRRIENTYLLCSALKNVPISSALNISFISYPSKRDGKTAFQLDVSSMLTGADSPEMVL